MMKTKAEIPTGPAAKGVSINGIGRRVGGKEYVRLALTFHQDPEAGLLLRNSVNLR